ncbi:MAG: hypothetical protein QXP36_11925, partial [Conexivisphaerales archaeon]
IYYYDAKYNNALKLVEQSASISKEDKEAIKEFIHHLRSQGVSVGRLAKYFPYKGVQGTAWKKL